MSINEDKPVVAFEGIGLAPHPRLASESASISLEETTRLGGNIAEYEAAYYGSLREQMGRYTSLSDIFPSYLTGFKKILSYHCEDGVFIVHWPAEKDSFEHRYSRGTIREVMTEIPELGIAVQTRLVPGLEFIILGTVLGLKDGSEKQISTYSQIQVCADTSAARWNGKLGQSHGVNQVQGLVTAHLMEQRPGDTQDVASTLANVVDGFKKVLGSRLEEPIQRYLAENPILISPAAMRIANKLELGREYVTDFVVQVADEEYVLVEIEPAGKNLFNKKGNASSALAEAERQVADWRQWVHDHIEYARSLMPGINDPDCWVIIGRRSSLTSRDKKLLARRNRDHHHVEVLTYDDRLDRATRYLENLRRLAQSQQRPVPQGLSGPDGSKK